MTHINFERIEKYTEYSSVAIGLVLGLIYLNPMAINSMKNEFKASVKNISIHKSHPQYIYVSTENLLDKKLSNNTDHIILASK